jgi:hypothetical protein
MTTSFRTKEEAVALASEIAAQVTESTPDADLALFVPYVFIETTMEAVGGKLEIGAEVSNLCVHECDCECLLLFLKFSSILKA